MRCLTAGLALSAVLAASQAPMVLTRSFWSGRQPESPPLPAEGSSLDFVLRPATAAGASTVALLASARLPRPIAETYGARAPGATQIVAVDAATGAVFSHAAEREGSAPLPASTGSRPKAAQSGDATVASIEVWFNADLRSHLELPSEARTYSVFLWLDDMTSPVHLAKLPASGSASGAPLAIDRTGLQLRKSGFSPRPPEHGLALRTNRDGIVYGAVDASGISDAFILTVLALDSGTRELASRSFRVSLQDLRASGGAFDFVPSTFFRLPKRGKGRLFVVGLAAEAISNVVIVQ
jgi:hypothetical protein